MREGHDGHETERIFMQYFRQLEDAERRHDIASIWSIINRLGTFPIESPLQSWLVRSLKTYYQLMEENIPKEKQKYLVHKLWILLKEGKDFLGNPIKYKFKDEALYKLSWYFVLVQSTYQNLIMGFLIVGLPFYDEFPNFEEIAKEYEWMLEKADEEPVREQDMLCYVMSFFYSTQGRLSLAEKYYVHTWERYGKSRQINPLVLRILTDYSGYLAQVGDIQLQGEVLEKLISLYTDGKVSYEDYNETLYEETIRKLLALLIQRGINLGYYQKEHLNGLSKLCSEILSGKGKDFDKLIATGNYIGFLYNNHVACPLRIRTQIQSFLSKFRKQEDFDGLVPWARSNYYKCCYYWYSPASKGRAGAYLEQMEKVLYTEEFSEKDRYPYILNMCDLLSIYCDSSRIEKAMECKDFLLHKLLEFYSMAEYYEDNKRMEMYMAIADMAFQLSYVGTYALTDVEKRFESSMNFKCILGSVLRLRNRMKPTEYGKRLKKSDDLPYFSYEQMEERIPEGTALLDVIYMNPAVYKTRKTLLEDDSPYQVELFAMSKRDGNVQRSQFMLADDRELHEMLEEYVDKMDHEGGQSRALSKRLYQYLLEPLQDCLRDAECLWICPDRDFCSLPFGLLIEENGGWKCRDIIYWYSLRDIFEIWDGGDTGKGNICAVGSPTFSLGGEIDEMQEKDVKRTSSHLDPLFYSAYEVQKITELLQGPCYLYKDATKFRVQPGYRYFHIATHGLEDMEEEISWNRNRLAFAGISDYLDQGRLESLYGNGSLTADEIGRMNLSGTELVMLSACSSAGSSFSAYRVQAGLHIAFGAAGVKYVIAALWSVDDLSTSVMMGFFYETIGQGMAIPEALERAKQQICNLTAGELLHILQTDRRLVPEAAREAVEQLEMLPPDYRLYSQPYYWAGFICYTFYA